MNIVTIAEASAIHEHYALILEREVFAAHERRIIQDEHGTIRWESDPLICMLFDSEALDLNTLFANGANKNDPLVRDLYRRLGYSLSGYWEVFYWDVNHEEWDEYKE